MKFFNFEIRKVKNTKNEIVLPSRTSGGTFYYSPKMTVGQMLANTTLDACVNIIADAVSSLQCNVYKKTEDGRIKQSIPLAKLLKHSPNSFDTHFTFFQQIMLHLLLRGNAFIFIHRKKTTGEIAALYPLNPDDVEIKMTSENEAYYVYTVDGISYKYNSESVLHIPAIRYNRLRGLSPIEYATHSAKTGLDLEEYTQNYFENGIHSKLIIKAPEKMGKVTKEDAQKISELVLSAYGGKENSAKPIVLANGFESQTLNISNNTDSQLIENRSFSEKEIAKIYRVPLFMLGSENSKFSNMEQSNTFFLQHTLAPWLVRLQEYLSKLLPYSMQDDCYVEFDTNSMLRADYSARWTNYRENFKNGLFTLNQIMDMENLPHVKGDIGDKHYMQMQYQELGKNNSSENQE